MLHLINVLGILFNLYMLATDPNYPAWGGGLAILCFALAIGLEIGRK